jgi:hypothetical protein
VEAPQEVLDLACSRLQDARQRSGLGLGLPSVVIGWLARGVTGEPAESRATASVLLGEPVVTAGLRPTQGARRAREA